MTFPVFDSGIISYQQYNAVLDFIRRGELKTDLYKDDLKNLERAGFIYRYNLRRHNIKNIKDFTFEVSDPDVRYFRAIRKEDGRKYYIFFDALVPKFIVRRSVLLPMAGRRSPRRRAPSTDSPEPPRRHTSPQRRELHLDFPKIKKSFIYVSNPQYHAVKDFIEQGLIDVALPSENILALKRAGFDYYFKNGQQRIRNIHDFEYEVAVPDVRYFTATAPSGRKLFLFYNINWAYPIIIEEDASDLPTPEYGYIPTPLKKRTSSISATRVQYDAYPRRPSIPVSELVAQLKATDMRRFGYLQFNSRDYRMMAELIIAERNVPPKVLPRAERRVDPTQYDVELSFDEASSDIRRSSPPPSYRSYYSSTPPPSYRGVRRRITY